MKIGQEIALPIFAVAVLCWPIVARAHAFPQAEQPMVGSTVTSPPAQVSIRFDAPIEPAFSKLEVFSGGNQNEDDDEPQVSADKRTLTVKLKALKPGDYTVKWRVVAEDGHATEGSYIFTVAGGK
jgi:copper resistance protein C